MNKDHSYSIEILKFSLAFVFIWFGFLKLLNVSPVLDVIAHAYPFFAVHPTAYLGLAVLEIALGIGILISRFIWPIGWIMVFHLFIATFGVLLSPQAFIGNFLVLSIVGEFVVKNFVLIAGILVVLSYERIT